MAVVKLSDYPRTTLEKINGAIQGPPIIKKEVFEVAVIPNIELNEEGELVVTFVDGSWKNLGKVVGETGKIPNHQISNGEIRFEKPDGTWGPWIRVREAQTIHVGAGAGRGGSSVGVDFFSSGEYLPQQVGADNVLTFVFNQAVHACFVKTITTDNNCGVIAYADPFGGTPADGTGIPCPEGEEATKIPFRCKELKVFAPANTLISVYGGRNTP